MRPEPGEDRSLVARPGPDLEDPVALRDLEILGHSRDHERLADGLAGIDREGLIGIGGPAAALGDERLARDGAHRREDSLVADATGAKLVSDHLGPCAFRIRLRTGHAGEDTPHADLPISLGSGR